LFKDINLTVTDKDFKFELHFFNSFYFTTGSLMIKKPNQKHSMFL